MRTPDLTPAQIVAFLAWTGSQAVAFGWISNGREQLLLSIGSTIVAAAWKLADSIIRHGRSQTAAAKELNALGQLFAPFVGAVISKSASVAPDPPGSS